jgi:hypothetical protein
MEMRKHTKNQAAATLLSIMILAGFAASAPMSGATMQQPHSFVGTTPDASDAEPQPPTF